MKKTTLGAVFFKSNFVAVSDPIRQLDEASTIKNIKKGTWVAHAYFRDKECFTLFAHHQDHYVPRNKVRKKVVSAMEIDSGQLGIFDGSTFNVDFILPEPLVGHKEFQDRHDQTYIDQYTSQIKTLKATGVEGKPVEFLENLIDVMKSNSDDPPKMSTNWYDICCDKTLSMLGAGMMRGGFVATASCQKPYKICVLEENGKVVAIKVSSNV